jgi:NADH-quinone oxidoreductase subunit N
VIGFVTSVIAAFYYIQIVKIIYFDEPAARFDRPVPVLRAVVVVSGLLVLFLFAYPGPFVTAAAAAAKSLF